MKGIRLLVVAMFMVMFMFVAESSAMVYFFDNKLEAEGVFYHQSIMRAYKLRQNAQYIEGRNSGEIQLLYHLIQEPCQARGLVDKMDIRTIVRGVYDNVYDWTDQWGYHSGAFGRATESRLQSEVTLREAYADIYKGKFYMRIGKQQIVWGKSDFFRLLDVINPLDYSWHFFFESFDEIRIPQKMILAQYSFGRVGFVENMSLQVVVNPEDFTVTNLGRYGQPWALAPQGFETYKKNKGHPTSVGGRLQGIIGPVSFTLNDFYTAYQDNSVVNLDKTIANGGVPVLDYPRINIMGGAVDWADEVTKGIWRLEMTYTPNKPMGLDMSSRNFPILAAKYPNWVAKRDELKYVLGFDRPTFIRCLNPNQTFFLSAQLFMTHVLKHETGMTNGGSAVKTTEGIVTLLANTNYMSNKLSPQVYVAYNVNGDGYVVGPSCSYLFTDHFSVKIGSNIIIGRDTKYAGFAATHDYNDEIYTRVQFTF